MPGSIEQAIARRAPDPELGATNIDLLPDGTTTLVFRLLDADRADFRPQTRADRHQLLEHGEPRRALNRGLGGPRSTALCHPSTHRFRASRAVAASAGFPLASPWKA